jgi:hypothetical protein
MSIGAIPPMSPIPTEPTVTHGHGEPEGRSRGRHIAHPRRPEPPVAETDEAAADDNGVDRVA